MYKEHGFVRVGCIVPEIKISDVTYNTDVLINKIRELDEQGVSIVLTPELSLTGYTCGDLFYQNTLLEECEKNLLRLLDETKELDVISIVGMPLKYKNKLYNVAVIINKGNILGVVPKSYIPNYGEFYEKRWFDSGIDIKFDKIRLCNEDVLFGTNLLFRDKENKDICFGIEICEDLWGVYPPSGKHALNGATIIFNPSASNEIVGKYEYRKDLVKGQSARCVGAYCYASSGVNESSSDLVFSGHAMIAENGKILKENERFLFDSNVIYTDIDVLNLVNERIRNNNYCSMEDEYKYVEVEVVDKIKSLERVYAEYPFVPGNIETKDSRCREIFEIQASGLAKRLAHTGLKKTVIGISGGLDSTLAYLVVLEAYKKLGISFDNIIGVTMPGFGTTDRTYKNACQLIDKTGATFKEVSIKEACIQHFKDIGLSLDDRSVTYENSQARERTQILMDIANKEGGIVVGTGDLSELALGWCTYNGDHISMYAVNSSIPKTLVRNLVAWKAYNSDGELGEVLNDILDTPISPELLPPDRYGKIKQVTENSIGPYVLHDFFLYHFFRYGESPEKIYLLARHTFGDKFSDEEIKKWLYEFFRRFFSQQFKRNCITDGPKVGSVSLSPRGDFRMPSDGCGNVWLSRIKKL